MEPNMLSLPQATSWYMNPFFMASFGAVVALGFVLFALAYFCFVKLKLGQKLSGNGNPEDCRSCGDIVAKYMPCRDHASIGLRLEFIEKWQNNIEEDYKELRRRVDAIERGKLNNGR